MYASPQGEEVPPYPQEAILIGAMSQMSASRALCTSPGLAQFAVEAAHAWPHASVACTYFDLFRASLALKHWPVLPTNVRIECSIDLADEEVDLVALPLSASGEAELTRELIQVGHERLRLGGKLYATTNNPDDTWLRDQLGNIFRKLNHQVFPSGVMYVGTKTERLKRVRSFSCEFAFRDCGRLIHAFSRPGVFSHRRVDAGTRHLMNAMQIGPNARVLDIGCGAGVVSLAAALRAEGVTVHAVDSNARAIQCTQRGAELNDLDNLTTELSAAGRYSGTRTYDMALANPPYYAGFRIAKHFLAAGREALRPGGRILLVTKRPDWYQQNMPAWYENVTLSERKGYYVVEGACPDDGASVDMVDTL
ncbi:MAG TPA: methyltransferase [Lacipirellulaceae bacterium]|nr:methyltransferase [Lacipirellulaceae bacterium]